MKDSVDSVFEEIVRTCKWVFEQERSRAIIILVDEPAGDHVKRRLGDRFGDDVDILDFFAGDDGLLHELVVEPTRPTILVADESSWPPPYTPELKAALDKCLILGTRGRRRTLKAESNAPEADPLAVWLREECNRVMGAVTGSAAPHPLADKWANAAAAAYKSIIAKKGR